MRLALFTDLDGTLLDSEDYSYEPALPVLRRLAERGDVVVPVTSKTPAELERLRQALSLTGPFVAENGAVVRIPSTVLGAERTQADAAGPTYSAIVKRLRELRASHGYVFRGFADMELGEIAALTGLSTPAAARAAQRVASEPLLWRDSPERLRTFTRTLQRDGLRVTQGGRFLHVMGAADKGTAVRQVMAHLVEHAPGTRWLSVGLGDAPNDLPMLRSVDVAVIIPSHRDFDLQPQASRVIRADAPGPVGWARTVEQILADLGE